MLSLSLVLTSIFFQQGMRQSPTPDLAAQLQQLVLRWCVQSTLHNYSNHPCTDSFSRRRPASAPFHRTLLPSHPVSRLALLRNPALSDPDALFDTLRNETAWLLDEPRHPH
ncbi:hypothetical protein C8F04DRAFT_1138929 [Mycena alexandri]|uniref:Uncharacterized protein n=1 Tax=Mycena alexandri TaxID=1745969 RepID=A0AAD6S4C5_9AGAR|nr:hypothetical protein C8F04DRAFT_1143682 [Mycena alexandri]KAJ7022078.1 hypothetical protein C8F04DRAFT_1138929 [Mycena alexandri]